MRAQISLRRNKHPPLSALTSKPAFSSVERASEDKSGANGTAYSEVAQWERAGLITLRSLDRNQPSLSLFAELQHQLKTSSFHICTILSSQSPAFIENDFQLPVNHKDQQQRIGAGNGLGGLVNQPSLHTMC